MKRIFRDRLLAVVLAFSMTAPVLADVAETVEKYRTSFERRMNAELDEHGKAARDLRLNYLEVLKKLKGELGRAENLKGATQVLAEIEMIEDGEESKDLPADADFRFKRVREKWERGLTEIRSARSKKLKTTVELYLKALDTEKRRLTRAGEIKDALVIEEEEKRVGDLPEVKALVITPEPGQPADEDLEDLALASRGAKASGGKDADLMIDGKTKHDRHKGWAFATNPCSFMVNLGAVHTINRIRLCLYDLDNRRYGYRIFVSEDGASWNQVRSNPRARGGWQEIGLEDTKLQFIRVHGLSNTENRNFHVVEIEAYGS
jgi:hypothetical protein